MDMHAAKEETLTGSEPAPWYWEKVNLFAGAAVQARHDFFSRSECLEFKRGRHMFHARDRAAKVFFLQSGLVKVYHLSPGGLVTIFWFCSAGDLLGAGAVAGTPQQAVNAQVMENAMAFAISRTAFEDVLRAHPQLAINLVRMVAGRLRLVSEMLTDGVGLRADERLARLLLRLAQNWGTPSPEGIRLKLPISHQEIGNMVGACRQTVNRIFGNFQRKGLINVSGRVITLAKSEKLMRLGDLGA